MWHCVLRIAIVLVAAVVLFNLSPVIIDQATGVAPCPAIGQIPACYLAGIGYVLIGISAVLPTAYSFGFFWVGWTPVFLLALTGSALELFVRPTCPTTSLDIPMCFISMGLASLLVLAIFLLKRESNKELTKEFAD